ncbi:MAG: hypothetical protein KA885_05530 [Spirochaetes bacterium]|nr:hypothetical protein [Spirochaetota bacterium]
MVFTQCDGCGKTFAVNNNTADPNIHYIQNMDFCDDCYEAYDKNVKAELKKSGNDMKVYLPKSHEVAKAMCSGGKKKK